MNENPDFVIRNGILTKYHGPGGDVTIPEGVTGIGYNAFGDCASLTSITIPEGVTDIDYYAFCKCTGLTSVTIPEGVTEILSHTFYHCTSLTHVSIPEGVTTIGHNAFDNCTSLQNVTIPKSTTTIGHAAFMDCASLTSVTIPEGVTEIGSDAFHSCTSLTSIIIPESVTSIGDYAFENCSKLTEIILPRSIRNLGTDYNGNAYTDKRYLMPEGLFQTDTLFDGGIAEQIRLYWVKQLTPRDWAYILMFQCGKKAFRYLCEDNLTDTDACAIELIEILKQQTKPTPFVNAVNFAIRYESKISTEHKRAIYDLAAARPKPTKTLKEALSILEPLLNDSADADPDSPWAFLSETYHQKELLQKLLTCKGDTAVLETVKLTDGKTPAPLFPVLCAIVPYAEQFHSPEYVGSYGNGYYRDTYLVFAPVELADQAAALLDRNSLMKALETLRDRHNAWLVPFCRYGDKELRGLLNKISKESTRITARGALMLSDSREAIMQLDKEGYLGIYAALHGTTAEILRDKQLFDFGLDINGKKVYDLGGNLVTVSLNPELTLNLYDHNAKKYVKSLPKKGADPELHKTAAAHLSEMKRNLKKVAKERCNQLFQKFLSGQFEDSTEWQKSYLGNPVLRQVASLLVWSQDGNTFTLRDGTAIDSSEQPYSISGGPVQVAHPMEMDPEDVAAWQKYFNNHAIKQPFAQIWEPVINFSSIRRDRYSGIEIPLYRFNQEKHGIRFEFDFDCSDLSIYLDDCGLDFDGGTAVGRHDLYLQGNIILKDFYYSKTTRRANHVISLLDKWTIYGRILKDDASVVAMLENATLAQVMQYLNLAIDNSKTNVTAELLNYKNEHFPDFDPLAEFTLEDL